MFRKRKRFPSQMLDCDKTLVNQFRGETAVKQLCGVTVITGDGEHTRCLFMSPQLKTWIQHGSRTRPGNSQAHQPLPQRSRTGTKMVSRVILLMSGPSSGWEEIAADGSQGLAQMIKVTESEFRPFTWAQLRLVCTIRPAF